MDKKFGKILRKQMNQANIKELELANLLNYDVTYINKWVNGKKLPSARNAECILRQISDLFSEKADLGYEIFLNELKDAYAYDSNYINIQAYSNLQLSCITDIESLYQLTKDVIQQAVSQKEKVIIIRANFDVFRLYGQKFRYLLKDLKDTGLEKIKIELALEKKDKEEDSFLNASGILHLLDEFDFIELTIHSYDEISSNIMTINDFFCLHILWEFKNELAVVFSVEKYMVLKFKQILEEFSDKTQKLLIPAESSSLMDTNIQITSYSDEYLWCIYNEAPSLLFPDTIMDRFIENAKDENYIEHLKKLKKVFSQWTRFSERDIILFASELKKYLFEGKVKVGNVSQELTKDEAKNHIRFLGQVMKENPKFKVWLIQDVVLPDDDIRHSMSLFIDTQAVYIENTKKSSGNNFYISMNPQVRKTFQDYFKTILNKPYCKRLTPEDLLKYII